MADDRAIDPNDPNAASRLLWRQFALPFSLHDAARAMFGLPPVVARQLAGAVTATSPEARQLLSLMPEMLRNMSITTTQTAIRSQGEVRGPILWAETMAARSGTAGSTDVFVCLTAQRAYDTPQNRVLVAALSAIRKAAADADPVARQAFDDAVLLQARVNGDEARRYLDHRTLRDVSRKRLNRRDVAKTTSGRRVQQYAPALAMIERAKNPISLNHLLAFSDARTAWQHWVLMTLATKLRARGNALPVFRPTPAGDLRAGRLTYRHPRTAADEKSPLHGILFERLLIDVPDPIGRTDLDAAAAELGTRANGRVPVLVTSADDVERAVDMAFSDLG